MTPAPNSPAEAQKTASGEAASIGLTSRQNVQRYSNDIDAVFTGTYPSGRVVQMGNTPDLLLRFGAAQRPVTLTQDTAYKIAYPEGYFGGKHNLGMSALKQLPYQIADPVAILRSTSQDNSLVLLTEWKDGDTDVIIPLHLDRAGALGLENRVPSAYGKGNIEALIGKSGENVLYTKNNEDIHQLLSKGVQFPQAMADDVLARNSIPDATPEVNTQNAPTASEPAAKPLPGGVNSQTFGNLDEPSVKPLPTGTANNDGLGAADAGSVNTDYDRLQAESDTLQQSLAADRMERQNENGSICNRRGTRLFRRYCRHAYTHAS